MSGPKSTYLSSQDLAWFSLEKYSGLANFNHQQWCDLILSRVELKRITKVHTTSFLLDVIDKLQRSPLSDFGYEISTSGFKMPKNESAVRMLDVSHLNRISDELRTLNAAPSELIDPMLEERRRDGTSRLPPLAHVAILLAAPEEKILGDFKVWLKDWRAQAGFVKQMGYESGPESWLTERVVPYFDLQLIASIQGKKLTKKLLAETIFPDGNEFKIEKKMRNMPALIKTVFGWGNINKMLGFAQEKF